MRSAEADGFVRTHHGSLHGVPVWLDMREPDCPGVGPKRGRGACLTVMELLFERYCRLWCMADPEAKPVLAIRVGAAVEPRSL